MCPQLTPSFLIIVGEINQEEIISITGLKPSHFYCIRTITHSISGFQSTGNAVRFQTKPDSVRSISKQTLVDDQDGQSPVAEISELFNTEPCMEVVSSSTAQSLLPMTVLESINFGLPRKNSTTKKSPNDHLPLGQGPSVRNEHNTDSIRHYSDRLEAVHRENEELQRSFARESDDFETSQIDLTDKINQLKQDLKRKEAESKEQKRKIAELEKHVLNSQHKKAMREKLLNEKVSAKEKFEKDISRWDQEVDSFYRNVESLDLERSQFSEQVNQELQMQRQTHLQHVQDSRLLEEEIHTIGISVEELKEQRRKQESDDWQHDSQNPVFKGNNESERSWDKKFNKLQSRYTSAWNQLQHAKVLQNQIQRKIDIYSSSQVSSHQPYPPTPMPDDMAERRVYSRHRRVGTNQSEAKYPPMGAFVSNSVLQISAPKTGSSSTESNSLVSKFPFPRYNNRFSFPMSQPSDVSPESDSFPGGAISPRAGDLLPAGLLGDDVGSCDDRTVNQKEILGRAFSTLPGLGAAIPGLGAVQSNEPVTFGPNSPSTPASGSPSLLSSPQNGTGNLYYANTSDYIDQDRRSTRSATSSLKGSASNTLSRASGTRFGNLFGLNRQRGKTLPDSGPAMGTLKPSESQSVPRPESTVHSENFVPRRRGSHSGSGSGQIVDLLRGDSEPGDEKYERNVQLGLKDGYFRKKAFNMFSGRNDPWAPRIIGKRSSPRPSSLGSTDTYLSRPSSQSKQQYGWSLDSSYSRRLDLEQQKLGLAAVDPWAQTTSRRASFTGSYALLLESDKANALADIEQVQPPIGTRPENSKNSAPKLNPNAPNFKSLFVRERKIDKPGKFQKEQETPKGIEKEENILHMEDASDEAQPGPYDLKENQPDSSTADTASHSSHEITKLDSGLDNGTILTTSNNIQGKETFMQKLSRKSSANKFTFSSFKNKDSIFSSRSKERSPALNTDLETDEESIGKDGDVYLSSSPNTNSGSGARSGGISWSSIKRMGKRGDKTPSVTESITSIVGDEDEE